MNNLNDKKIIFATDVIETGFTGKNIYYVIDCLSFRSVTYNPLYKYNINVLLPCDKNKT